MQNLIEIQSEESGGIKLRQIPPRLDRGMESPRLDRLKVLLDH